ncbi:MAG: hypothetical protein NVS4B11_20360 [Ktedonobacteraceae bacterium]
MKNSLYILWLEGIDPEQLITIPAISALIKQGVDVKLTPQPIIEAGQCYYQTLTGLESGKLGRFDAVRPEGYQAHENTETPEGALNHTLPELLRSRKLATTSVEIQGEAELDALVGHSYDLALIRLRNAGKLTVQALDAVVKRCSELATSEAHFVVLTDVWNIASKAFVNVNDFLADVGLLEVGEPRQQGSIVWAETLAYGLGSGQIWVNLRGRETQGAVGSGREYQEVCTALIRELKANWLDPQTKAPIVEQVYKKDELYNGDYLFKAPDLVTVYHPGYIASQKAMALALDGASVLPVAEKSVAQAAYARLIASGPSLQQGHTAQAKLVDVVPSLLYLLGQSLPRTLDGEVVKPVFTSAYLEQTPINHAEDDKDMLSDEEEGMIVDRLRDLGYLG